MRPKLLLFRLGSCAVSFPNRMDEMCDFSRLLRWKRCTDIFCVDRGTCRQVRAAVYEGNFCLNNFSSVALGRPLLTASARPFLIPTTCPISMSNPMVFHPIASSFVILRPCLLGFENLLYQLLAEVLSPPQCALGCQRTVMCPCIYIFAAA